MVLRSLAATAILTVATFAVSLPADAATHHHRHSVRSLTVTRLRGLPVPPDPIEAATPNFTGSNGVTTDVNVFPDGAVGDGFPGTQTPGLNSYGLDSAALYTPYQLQ